jgi:hypothetical protein
LVLVGTDSPETHPIYSGIREKLNGLTFVGYVIFPPQRTKGLRFGNRGIACIFFAEFHRIVLNGEQKNYGVNFKIFTQICPSASFASDLFNNTFPAYISIVIGTEGELSRFRTHVFTGKTGWVNVSVAEPLLLSYWDPYISLIDPLHSPSVKILTVTGVS